MSEKKIIFTGGKGLLGTEFKKIRPDISYTYHEDFNVLNYDQMKAYVEGKGYELILHAAAFTSPPRIDKDPREALEVNIVGTANVVKLCIEFDLRLIYVSTDYVFKGDIGNYKETDPVFPINKYAWSKLGGECAAMLYDKALIVRTTFGPNVFPYDKAFVDQWTSRESVSVIARMISELIDKEVTGIIHVGGRRKTVLDYAKELSPTREIGRLSINDVSFNVPCDTSLNCDRYISVVNSKKLMKGNKK